MEYTSSEVVHLSKHKCMVNIKVSLAQKRHNYCQKRQTASDQSTCDDWHLGFSTDQELCLYVSAVQPVTDTTDMRYLLLQLQPQDCTSVKLQNQGDDIPLSHPCHDEGTVPAVCCKPTSSCWVGTTRQNRLQLAKHRAITYNPSTNQCYFRANKLNWDG